MKKNTFFLLFLFVSLFSKAQTTAQDFTVVDCRGDSHHLFDTLDAGKVVVISWVMPCLTCKAPTQTAYNIVQSYLTTYTNKILFYIADDDANTPCASLRSAMGTSNYPKSYWITDPTATETYYGTGGMPKIVVLGKSSHKVFFKQNAGSGLDQQSFKDALDSALYVAPTSTNLELNFKKNKIQIYPNPIDDAFSITVEIEKTTKAKIEVYNYLGSKEIDLFDGILNEGKNELKFNNHNLSLGVYLLKFSSDNFNKTEKICVFK